MDETELKAWDMLSHFKKTGDVEADRATMNKKVKMQRDEGMTFFRATDQDGRIWVEGWREFTWSPTPIGHHWYLLNGADQ